MLLCRRLIIFKNRNGEHPFRNHRKHVDHKKACRVFAIHHCGCIKIYGVNLLESEREVTGFERKHAAFLGSTSLDTQGSPLVFKTGV